MAFTDDEKIAAKKLEDRTQEEQEAILEHEAINTLKSEINMSDNARSLLVSQIVYSLASGQTPKPDEVKELGRILEALYASPAKELVLGLVKTN